MIHCSLVFDILWELPSSLPTWVGRFKPSLAFINPPDRVFVTSLELFFPFSITSPFPHFSFKF